MISVLFVEKKSVYKTLYVDAWDEQRDARLYRGSNVVICHPPCRLWSRLRKFSTAPDEEKQLALLAVELVRKNGGILEHPSGSSLWKEPCIQGAGFVISVDQHWWGHPCRKKTLLLINGIQLRDLPAVPLNFNCPEKVINTPTNRPSPGRHLPVRLRNHTPKAFATWLIEVAKIIEKKR